MNPEDSSCGSSAASSSSGPEETEEEIKKRQIKENINIRNETGLSFDDINEFREIFELVDEDKGGSIDMEELRKLTDLMNLEVPTDELETMVREIDTSGTGEIFFNDFVKSMSTKPKVDYTEKDIIDAFRFLSKKDIKNPNDSMSFNKDKPGKISQTRLEWALMNYGEKLTKKETEHVLGMSEFSGAGYLDYVDLVKTLMSSAYKK